MKRTLLILLYVLTLGAMFFVAGERVVRAEAALTHGKIFTFKVAPFDPHDPFRGRYLQLNILPNHWKGTDFDRSVRRRSTVYAVLTQDKGGFAAVQKLVHEKPASGDFVPVRYHHYNRWDKAEHYHQFSFMFDRFYLNERKAPQAETLLRTGLKNGSVTIKVRIRRGMPVIVDLLIGGKKINEVLKEKQPIGLK